MTVLQLQLLVAMFHYNTALGVLLPGEVLDFPFHFKSRNPGIFSERWLLATSPVLNRGRQLLVTLKGVSWQEDLYKDRRDEIEVYTYRTEKSSIQHNFSIRVSYNCDYNILYFRVSWCTERHWPLQRGSSRGS